MCLEEDERTSYLLNVHRAIWVDRFDRVLAERKGAKNRELAIERDRRYKERQRGVVTTKDGFKGVMGINL